MEIGCELLQCKLVDEKQKRRYGKRELFLAFRSEKQTPRACVKLRFDAGLSQSVAIATRGSAIPGQQMEIEAMDIVVPGSEVSKRRLIGSDLGQSSEKIRVIQADGFCTDGSHSKAEVAEQPGLHQ